MANAARIPGTLPAALETARRTHDAHASAIDALERAFDAEMDQLAKDRRALEDDRAAFIKGTEEKLARDDEEQTRMRAAAPPPGERIKLNVGGARFEVSRAVLTKVEDSMVGRMFGRCDAMLQPDPEDGSIFIDRDGERFGMLLDFLRGDPPDGPRMQRAIRALPEAVQDALVQELDYFGLETAVFSDRPWTDGATFRPGPVMRSARNFSPAVLAGGRIIVFGGCSPEFSSDSTEVLDVQTMAFTAGPNLVTRRDGCAAVQIDADRVLVMGGFTGDANGPITSSTEILHLSTLTFTPGPNMLSPRCLFAAVALDARRILVVGGRDGVRSEYSSTEILSLDSMSFVPGPTLAAPRSGCTAVALDEHNIMVTGGVTAGVFFLDTTEVLDIRTMEFAPGPSMGSARNGSAAVPVDGRYILIIGGVNSSKSPSVTTELLDLVTMEFAPGPTMQTGRYGCVATRLNVEQEQARILVIGGRDGLTSLLSTTEVLAVEDPNSARTTRRRTYM